MSFFDIMEINHLRYEEFDDGGPICSGCYEKIGDLDAKTEVFTTAGGRGDLFWHLPCAVDFSERMAARLKTAQIEKS